MAVLSQFFHADAKISKLATHEDPQHLHKTLGILSLCSFIYRYGYVYNTQGNLGFDGMNETRNKHMVLLDFATMLVHTLLAFSSILFRVPKKRISNKPMIIYEEYRQHAMVFTARCFSVFLVSYFFPNGPSYLAPVVVMSHHLLADRITTVHGTPDNTAVRATSAHMKLSNFYKAVSKGYSLYQFLAIASHVLPNERLADLAYNAIIAIQSSAFLMTLYRKRIIKGKTHMAIYGFCLVLSTFHIIRCIGLNVTLATLFAFTLRCNIPRQFNSKYVIWAIFFIAVYWTDIDWMGVYRLIMEVPAIQGSTIALGVYIAFSSERLLFHDPSLSRDPSSNNLNELTEKAKET